MLEQVAPTPTTYETGNADQVVVVGAHLDSVIAGPGINDNGSGSSTILEIAEEMAELGIRNRQQVRFAFWGAEELNLLGSEHYVDTLSDDDLGKIVANLHFDMLGSPNYVRFVYELGDGAAHAVMTLARSRTGFFEDGSYRTRAGPPRRHAAVLHLASPA